MMLLMGTSYGQQIRILGVSKQFEPLMDENIMYEKISHSIQRNSNGNIKVDIKIMNGSVIHQDNRWNCKNGEKIIVPFHMTFIAVVMMIPVKRPQKAMHDVFVDAPGHSFHHKKSK